jgi:hypothetical protein
MAAGDELVLGRPQQALPALGVFDNFDRFSGAADSALRGRLMRRSLE